MRALGRGQAKRGPTAPAGAHPTPGPPGPARGPLTTLSSGTERLRVHSWLFTKESVGEKVACQHTHLYCGHLLSPTCPFLGQGQKAARSDGTPTLSPRPPGSSRKILSEGNGAMIVLRERTRRAVGLGPLAGTCVPPPLTCSSNISNSHLEPHPAWCSGEKSPQ